MSDQEILQNQLTIIGKLNKILAWLAEQDIKQATQVEYSTWRRKKSGVQATTGTLADRAGR